MLVRVRAGNVAPNYLRVLYEPGRVFNFELGEGVPLPPYLEAVPEPEPAPPAPEDPPIHRRRRHSQEARQ